jgi:hypothetical protein
MVQFGFSFFYLDLLPLTANADNVYASRVRRRQRDGLYAP